MKPCTPILIVALCTLPNALHGQALEPRAPGPAEVKAIDLEKRLLHLDTDQGPLKLALPEKNATLKPTPGKRESATLQFGKRRLELETKRDLSTRPGGVAELKEPMPVRVEYERSGKQLLLLGIDQQDVAGPFGPSPPQLPSTNAPVRK